MPRFLILGVFFVLDDKSLESLKGASKLAARALLNKLLKSVLKYLAPYLAVACILFVFLLLLVGGVYSAFPSEGTLAGVRRTDEDERMRQTYQKLCDEYNVKDTWLVPGEGLWYPQKGTALLGSLVDRYGNDYRLRLLWGQLHAACLYHTYSNDGKEITDSLMEKTADDLHPYFYYKESTVTVCGKDGCESYPVYLLVEAYAIQGHFQYSYEWVTEDTGDGGSITYERLKEVRPVGPDIWKRLKDWMVKEYKIANDDELDLARLAVWEAGTAYTEQKEWLEWLISNFSPASYLSAAMIPPEVMGWFKEAADRFGVPWWFLAAVAWKESGFNMFADNSSTGSSTHCYGVMQVSDENWENYAPRLGFDPVADRNNPRAQIFVGAYMLANLLGHVDWDSPDWKEQTLSALMKYGGYVKVPLGKPYSSPEEWCRAEYAGPIWDAAERFRDRSVVWPTPGYTQITDTYMEVDSLHPNGHKGIDIAAPEGAEVVSVSSGVVTFTGNLGNAYGNYVTIRDGNYLYLYAHLSRIAVSKGDVVAPGQVIGYVGQTGRAFGAHLHFEVRDSFEKTIDPLLVLMR